MTQPMPARSSSAATETQPIIRVLVVDDHAVVCAGLRYFLATVDDIEVVGQAESGLEALDLCEDLHPDVVVIDMKMEEMDGATTTQHIRERYPQIRVLILSSFSSGDLVQRALKAGANGYMLKAAAGRELVRAIRDVYAGRLIMAHEATQALVDVVTHPVTAHDDLSQRERAVLALMVNGLSNDQIASRLIISRNTVRHHVQNILSKLGVVNRTQAVALAVEHGLATPSPLA
jgi:two-component system, NarL family, response regulator LiaR